MRDWKASSRKREENTHSNRINTQTEIVEDENFSSFLLYTRDMTVFKNIFNLPSYTYENIHTYNLSDIILWKIIATTEAEIFRWGYTERGTKEKEMKMKLHYSHSRENFSISS